ncbi:hypothetical protein BSY16_4825 (plasmid) [Sinorhizobium sp. RAC02]|nr:hypothetical protein BSY16_4825 [Sinorhizobium sp. RAC02]
MMQPSTERKDVNDRARALSRRVLLLGMVSSTLTACSTLSPAGITNITPSAARRSMGLPSEEELAARYAGLGDGGYTLPAVPYQQIDPKFYRQRVMNTTGEPAGTVVVDIGSRFLYVVEPGGTAMRYGVGLGRAGFAWEGEGVVQWRQRWPRWKAPAEMIARQPELAKFSVENGGQPPGPDNALGAPRPLYLPERRRHALSPAWDSRVELHRHVRFLRLRSADQPGCHRPPYPGAIEGAHHGALKPDDIAA